jgi:hypothetical protein
MAAVLIRDDGAAQYLSVMPSQPPTVLNVVGAATPWMSS